MPHPCQAGNFHHYPYKQRGAALMVMLVIMIIGSAAFLVSSFSSSALQIGRDKITADALAQAKEALIGRAVGDANHPGSLPCPDTNDDGSAESLSGNDCPSYIGRLPWKTLGLPDLRDGYGEHLWYVLSRNFRDDNSNSINSDTAGNLTVSGTTTASSIIAIVFAPGNALSGQSRSATQTAACTTTGSSIAASLCATNYLEGSNANLNTLATLNLSYQTAATSITFNDQLIFIAHDQLSSPVEKRIAREVKACLDEYAANSANKYPWAVLVNDPSYTGTFNTLFGRISYLPNISTSPPSAAATTLSAALSALQAAVNNFAANGSSANQTALINAGNYVVSLKNSIPAISSTVDTAGDWGVEFAGGQHTQATVLTKITSANTALTPYLSVSSDPAMSTSWPDTASFTCIFNKSYWLDWKDLVFYQIADNYHPGGTASCTTNVTCLSITGSGNNVAGSGTYRAVVVVAGKKLGASRTSSNIADYLEPDNLLPQSDATKPYKTYRPTDPGYQSVNDLALCVDGRVNCK